MIFIVFGLLGLRLIKLQLLDHEKYKELARNNTSKTLAIRAPRGSIFDREGRILATSKQSLSIVILASKLKKHPERLDEIANLLSNFVSYSHEELKMFFDKIDARTPLPILVENDVAIENVIKIYENQDLLPGVYVEKQAVRYYPYHDITGHFIGYVGQINDSELKRRRSEGLVIGDIVGKDGLEKIFDENLRGEKGEERVAVDRYGKSVETSAKQNTIAVNNEKTIIKAAKKGKDINLTIDIDLQQAAYNALKQYSGAAVAIDPRNGEILTLVSTPTFDPNIFTKPVSSKVYREFLENKVFLDRSLSAYPPGSIWKPLSSLVILEKQLINPYEKLPVSGSIFFNGFRFGDWTSKEDQMNLIQALAWSRNTYFYQLAKKMKPEWLAKIGDTFGIGRKTGAEVLNESSGILPSPQWKKKKLKEAWFPGNTLHYSIGQSFLLVTPIQAARMIAGIANNGALPQPHLIKDSKKEKLLKAKMSIKKKNFELVKKGLRACVASGTGTMARPWGSKISILGKTGSAEVPGYKKSTHAWFVGYAPENDPQIAVAVFAEGAGHGGSIAAPVAQRIFAEYFKKHPQTSPKL